MLTKGLESWHKFDNRVEGIIGFNIVEKFMTTSLKMTFDALKEILPVKEEIVSIAGITLHYIFL